MDNGADPMIPSNDNKDTAFHYCGKSGNSEVEINLAECTMIIFIFVGCERNNKTFTCWADSAGGK